MSGGRDLSGPSYDIEEREGGLDEELAARGDDINGRTWWGNDYARGRAQAPIKKMGKML